MDPSSNPSDGARTVSKPEADRQREGGGGGGGRGKHGHGNHCESNVDGNSTAKLHPKMYISFLSS